MTENAPGAYQAPRQAVQKSRTRAYRRAYQRTHYATVSACITRPEKEAFRDACRRVGKSQHEVISDLVAEWMAEREAFDYSQPPVIQSIDR